MVVTVVRHLKRPFAWIMVVLSAVLLVIFVARVVGDPSETGSWLTGLGMVMCLCVFASVLAKREDK